MTDHKTVREALEFAVELCAMRTDFMNKSAIIYGQRMPIEDIKDCLSNALAALDRIEDVETVTVDTVVKIIGETIGYEYGTLCPTDVESFFRAMEANGLRIVQAARQPEQPSAPINQAYEG